MPKHVDLVPVHLSFDIVSKMSFLTGTSRKSSCTKEGTQMQFKEVPNYDLSNNIDTLLQWVTILVSKIRFLYLTVLRFIP